MSDSNICLRCGHEWVSQISNTLRCPNCGSQQWADPDLPRWSDLGGDAPAVATQTSPSSAAREPTQESNELSDRKVGLVNAVRAFVRRKNLALIFPDEYQALVTAFSFYEDPEQP